MTSSAFYTVKVWVAQTIETCMFSERMDAKIIIQRVQRVACRYMCVLQMLSSCKQHPLRCLSNGAVIPALCQCPMKLNDFSRIMINTLRKEAVQSFFETIESWPEFVTKKVDRSEDEILDEIAEFLEDYAMPQ